MFKDVIKKIIEAKLADEQDIEGCSLAEIAVLEDRCGNPLPKKYKDFMVFMGRKAGRFLQGTDIFYSSVSELRIEAIDLLKENKEEFQLLSEYFVFSMHQGYEFLFFDCYDGDDPIIYQYIEGEGEPKKAWGSFSSFINETLQQHL